MMKLIQVILLSLLFPSLAVSREEAIQRELPTSQLESVMWRLGAGVADGFSDFMFEICVLRQLPPERLSPENQKVVAQLKPAFFAPRLAILIQKRLQERLKSIAETINERGIAGILLPMRGDFTKLTGLRLTLSEMRPILDEALRSDCKLKDEELAVLMRLYETLLRGRLPSP